MVNPPPSRPGSVSVVVVEYRSGPALRRCIESLVNRSDIATRVIIVDNNGSDHIAGDLTREFSSVVVLDPGRNVGFAAGVNLGLADADGEWLALINPDTIIPPGILGALVDVLRAQPSVAAVAPRLDWPIGSPQLYLFGGEPTPAYLLRRGVARIFGAQLHDWGSGKARAVDWVSGACLVLRRSALDQVGALDERFFLYFEDVDWCRRCREVGWQIWFMRGLAVLHESRPDYRDYGRRERYRASLLAYYKKYYGSV